MSTAPNDSAEPPPEKPSPAEAHERRSQVRGLLFLALAVILFSILRAGVHRSFGVGWWRLW